MLSAFGNCRLIRKMIGANGRDMASRTLSLVVRVRKHKCCSPFLETFAGVEKQNTTHCFDRFTGRSISNMPRSNRIAISIANASFVSDSELNGGFGRDDINLGLYGSSVLFLFGFRNAKSS